MPATDANGQTFNVGDVVNVPCVVTALTPANGPAIAALTLTTIYAGANGNTDSVSSIDASEVVLKK